MQVGPYLQASRLWREKSAAARRVLELLHVAQLRVAKGLHSLHEGPYALGVLELVRGGERPFPESNGAAASQEPEHERLQRYDAVCVAANRQRPLVGGAEGVVVVDVVADVLVAARRRVEAEAVQERFVV